MFTNMVDQLSKIRAYDCGAYARIKCFLNANIEMEMFKNKIGYACVVSISHPMFSWLNKKYFVL